MAIEIREDSLNSGSIQSGLGAPTHLAAIGTLFTDKSTGTIYINKNGSNFWVNISSSGSTGGGSITAFTYNQTNNTFSIVESGVTYDAAINIMSGLTVNNSLRASIISATTYQNLPPVATIYTSDGTLTGTRTVTQAGLQLNFVGGTMFINGKLQQGVNVFANGTASHAEGRSNVATGNYSHVEGFSSTTNNQYSHAEGRQTFANADYSHAEGYQTRTFGAHSHAEGRSGTTFGQGSHAEGYLTRTTNQYSHAEGREANAQGDYSHAEGFSTLTNNDYAHAEGYQTTASTISSHAEGRETQTLGGYSHSEGYLTVTNNDYTHAEGRETRAEGTYSHVEGFQSRTYIGADGSHAEGDRTSVYGNFGHAEGRVTIVNSSYGHAEGDTTTVGGYGAHAEGKSTQAIGNYSHSEGEGTITNGRASKAIGRGTQADADYQFVFGKFNITGNTTSLGIIGNGLSAESRSNLVTFNQNNVSIFGDLYVSGNTFLGNGTFTKAGYATGDVLLDNNGTDTPGVLFYYANNSNYGIDSWSGSYDVLSGQILRVVNKLNETGGAVKLAIDTTGNMVASGFIKANAWRAGQVVNDIMLSNTEVTISTTTIATSTSDTDFLTYSYTPLSSSSYLVIHYHLASFSFEGGTGNDSYFSRIKVDGNEITYSRQSTVNGNRTGVLFPLTGRYTNSNTTAKSIVVACRRDSADDSITIVNSSSSMWLRITEIAR